MLHFAAQNKSVDVVKVIINTGEADVRAVDKDQQTALHYAARHNPSAIVIRTLIEAGSDVDARADFVYYQQRTSLHFAARWNPSADVIKALIANGADADARDNTQHTPLHLAASSNEGAVKALVERKANVNVLNVFQESPLFFAALGNNREAIIELCQAGAKPHLGKYNPLDSSHVADEIKIRIREKCSSL